MDILKLKEMLSSPTTMTLAQEIIKQEKDATRKKMSDLRVNGRYRIMYHHKTAYDQKAFSVDDTTFKGHFRKRTHFAVISSGARIARTHNRILLIEEIE